MPVPVAMVLVSLVLGMVGSVFGVELAVVRPRVSFSHVIVGDIFACLLVLREQKSAE